MDFFVKLKQLALALGDLAVMYFSLGITIFIRYSTLSGEIAAIHFWPFTIIFAIWLMVFYIGGLYELRELKNDLSFAKKYLALIGVGAFLAITFFYFAPGIAIAPKTNLFVFLVVFSLSAFLWRNLSNSFLSAGAPNTKVLLVGYNKSVQEIVDYIGQNPQLGYEITFWMREGLQDKEFEHLSQIIAKNGVNMIVVPAHIKKNSRAARLIYRHLMLGIEILDLEALYGRLLGKIPLEELEEVWFLENLAKSHKIYEFFKRPIEILLSLLILIITLPLSLLTAMLIKISSPGQIMYSQTRTGKREKEFTIYKFRTMREDAEKDGAQWAQKDDQRVTFIGKFLRRTHFDELPQLLNVLKGELSIVGPRPERPEFVGSLKRDIPYYELRHISRPGITGWAQINYRYGASVEDAYEKLQYEIFYLKNRSVLLDILIIIKTIRLIFTRSV